MMRLPNWLWEKVFGPQLDARIARDDRIDSLTKFSEVRPSLPQHADLGALPPSPHAGSRRPR